LLKGVFNESKKALNRVPGKEVIKQFSSWAHATYGRGISLRDVLREIRASEVPEELRKVVQSLETNKGFNL